VAGTANDVAANALDNRGLGGGDVLTTAANAIGISVADLRTELQAGKSLADVAVEKGKTRQDVIDALTKAEGQRIAQLVDQKGLGAKAGTGPGFRLDGNTLAVAAKFIGISEQDLRTKLAAGQTLAAIATANGKTRQDLIAALVKDQTDKIDAAQQANRITVQQAATLKSGITDRITKLVDATGPWGHGPGLRRGRP
jgi:predicted transcriptional regulator